MNRKFVMIGLVGVILLGGALGAGAFSEPKQPTTSKVPELEKAAVTMLPEANNQIEDEKAGPEPKEEGNLPTETAKVEASVKDSEVQSGAANESERNAALDEDDHRFETVSAAKINSQKQEHSAEINAVVKFENQNNSAATKNVKKQTSTRITKEEAIKIATNETPGRVIEVEYEDGEYEIEIRTKTHEIEYEIDAKTGRILEKDIDDLDDD